jgi:hypothetical protein
MRRKGKKLVESKKTVYDGTLFKSRLEYYMYSILKLAGLSFEYEGESFVVLESFKDENRLYTKHSKSFVQKGERRVLGIKYTPDFIVKVDGEIRFIIETKGRINESFPIRFKLFRKYINDRNLKWDLFIPTNQKQCDETLKLIQDAIAKN